MQRHNIIHMACQVPMVDLANMGIFHIQFDGGHYLEIISANNAPPPTQQLEVFEKMVWEVEGPINSLDRLIAKSLCNLTPLGASQGFEHGPSHLAKY